jgi:hypothetical protein
MTMETMVDLILNVILFLVLGVVPWLFLVVVPWLFQGFVVLCVWKFLMDSTRQ